MIDLAKQEAHKQKKAQLDASMPKPMEKPQVSYAEQFKPDMSVESPGHTFNETPQMVGALERKNYVRGFNTWAEAEKAGDVSQQEWANEQIQKMVSEGKNPGEFINTLSFLGSAESPDEIKKRERREALGETFRNLGGLIGNVANLYYTNKGGQYIDLNTANEKHRERMQRLKDKQDALTEHRNNILINAKLGDLKAERAEALAKQKQADEARERELKLKYDAYMKELDDAYKKGQITLQSKLRMQEEAEKAKYAEVQENKKHANRVAIATMNNQSAEKRAEMRENGKLNKSTLTYNGKSYKKNDLSSMIAMYKQLKKDGWTIKEVKDTDEKKADVKDYIKAILGAAKPDPNKWVKRVDIIDSDVSGDEEEIYYTPEDEFDVEFK